MKEQNKEMVFTANRSEGAEIEHFYSCFKKMKTGWVSRCPGQSL